MPNRIPQATMSYYANNPTLWKKLNVDNPIFEHDSNYVIFWQVPGIGMPGQDFLTHNSENCCAVKTLSKNFADSPSVFQSLFVSTQKDNYIFTLKLKKAGGSPMYAGLVVEEYNMRTGIIKNYPASSLSIFVYKYLGGV